MNSLIYIRRNKRHLVVIAIIALAVLCVSFITTLVSSVYYTALQANTSPFEKFSVVSYYGNEDPSIELSSAFDFESMDAYHVCLSATSIKTVFGTTSSYLFFLKDKSTFDAVIEKCNIVLTAGKFPAAGEKELILHEDILKNKGLQIDKTVNDYKIVGSFSGEVRAGFGLDETNETAANSVPSISYILFPPEDELPSLNDQLQSLDSHFWSYTSSEKLKEKLDEEFSSTNTILTIVVIMISACLAISTAAIVYSSYANRFDEFAILSTMGYKKRTIVWGAIKEILATSVFSWITGYLCSIVLLLAANAYIYSDLGQVMPVFTLDSLMYTLSLPLFSVLFTAIPIAIKLRNTDLISIIERR